MKENDLNKRLGPQKNSCVETLSPEDGDFRRWNIWEMIKT